MASTASASLCNALSERLGRNVAASELDAHLASNRHLEPKHSRRPQGDVFAIVTSAATAAKVST